MRGLMHRLRAVLRTIAEQVKASIPRLRANKNYGRAKRWVWQVSTVVAATTGGEILTSLLHGR